MFCRYAASNTRRGVESCGILAGILDEKNACFQICTLIIPKQEGTSDTVQVCPKLPEPPAAWACHLIALCLLDNDGLKPQQQAFLSGQSQQKC
jgi:hypothetical protein